MAANQEWCACRYCRRDMPGNHHPSCPLAGPIGPLTDKALRLWQSGWFDGFYQTEWDDEGNEFGIPPRSNHPAYKLGWQIGEYDLEVAVEQAEYRNRGYEGGDDYQKLIF